MNAVRKGGDFDVLVQAGRRVLAASPLHAENRPGTGVTWPPFEGVFMLPFALVADQNRARRTTTQRVGVSWP